MLNYANYKMIKFPASLTTITPYSKLLAGILFIALIITAFFAGMKYQAMTDFIKIQQSNLITAPPSPTPDPTANWKVYRDEKYGFEINYPKDWKKNEDFSGIIFSESEPASGQGVFWQGTFRISISSNSGQLNLNEWIQNFKQESATGANLIRGIVDVTLGGRPAKKASVFAFDGENIETITVDKTNVYNLWFEDAGENDPDNSRHLQIYNQMLSTFKFLDKDQIACTQEAKLCPDGKTYVSRTGPNCEFALCP